MNKEDFYGTFWDVSDWTEGQKIQWQQRCFELGFSWSFGLPTPKYFGADTYFLEKNLGISYSSSQHRDSDCPTEKHYEDMFPAQPEEKLDIIAEIVKLVRESQSVEEEGEESFDGLVYVAPEVSSYIFVPDLSDEQKNFLDSNLKWADSDRLGLSDYKILNFGTGNSKWCLSSVTGGRTKINFNDIFQCKEA